MAAPCRIQFIVVVKKRSVILTFFSILEIFISTIEILFSTIEIFISTTTYAPILYYGTFSWKRV
jgi:hypothetical protein